MKQKILIGLGIVFIAFLGYSTYVYFSPPKSPPQITNYSFAGLDLKVTYSRPYKKGRVIFGSKEDGALLPNGKYWRLGANDATEITFSRDVNFAGMPVKAETYRMYAVPNATSWQISLNSEKGKFGYFEPDYSKDVVKVDIPLQAAPSETEQFTINFSSDSTGVMMDFLWDKALVRVPITIQ
jgi:hypothetical protein